ncbi:MAG: ABC transporter substrate-binding protein [Candidatus Aminicenantes bacterium]|nr:ABC transporter substrate-binding protein [Candidatus Aminicenantes bacterium]
MKGFSYWAGILGIFLILLGFISFLHSNSSIVTDRFDYKGTLHIKSFAENFREEMDPASPDSYIFVSEQLYDGLVRLEKKFRIVPSLAEYWKISPDGKNYTFYLRKGVKFHHGSEMTAEDVKFSLERLVDSEVNSPYSQFFIRRIAGAEDFWENRSNEVKGFKVLDKYTFEIEWTKPYSSALYLMSMHFCKILPKEEVKDRGKGFFRKPSGTGPFQFTYWLRTPKLEIVGIRMERYNAYFAGRPYLEAIEFCPLYTLDHFVGKEIDMTPVLSRKLLSPEYYIYQDLCLHPVYLGMSCHIFPFNNPQVRRAVSFAIDKKKLAEEVYDVRYSFQVTHNFIPPRLPGFFPREVHNGCDPNRAKELLRQAGFSDSEEFPDLTLFIEAPRTDPKIRAYREIRDELGKLGWKLRVRYYRTPDEIRDYDRPYLVFFGRMMNIPDPEDIIRPLFFSHSSYNILGYEDTELDELLQNSEVENSWKKRINLFRRMEDILSDDLPALPLFIRQNRMAVQPWVKGLEVPPLGLHYIDARKIWLEK